MEPISTFALAALIGTSAMNRSNRSDFISFGGSYPQSTLTFGGVEPPAMRRAPAPAPSYNTRSEAIAALWDLRNVEAGWDGDEGIVPTEDAIDAAEYFLYALPYEVQTPRVGLASDGEIGLYWETEGFFADVGFLADGTFGYYATSPAGEISREGLTFDGIPADLHDHLPIVHGLMADAA